jgi:hypothetical protein
VFQKSLDHATVTSYRFDIFASGVNVSTATPQKTADLGKPTPASNGDITVDESSLFSTLATGSYQGTVTAISSTGQSRSSPVSFTK